MNRKKICLLLVILLALLILTEVLFAHPHYAMPWNIIPGADVLIGFGGAWLLILLAKVLMAHLLQRDEDYYDKNEREEDSADA